jgi:hypothetical protein
LTVILLYVRMTDTKRRPSHLLKGLKMLNLLKK